MNRAAATAGEWAALAAGRGDLAPGDWIGLYRIVQLLGEGGFGLVYLAEQERPLRRRVAVKVLKPGMDSAAILARFETERQALALMDHPNIAKVIDAGTTMLGRPYFVMEYVVGEPITDFCDRHALSTEERLVLFVRVCEGVQHAHQKGVIHRDLKPSNVLVSAQQMDGRDVPVPRVIDFGVAKAVSAPLTGRPLVTEIGQLLGTPEYMSPEQAENSGLDVDTRSDVYSLGVLLYELLTGTLPFDSVRLRRAVARDIPRIIREAEAPRPSTRVSAGGGAAAHPTMARGDLHALSRRLRGDLDWITMRAIEKDRSRRYDSPSALAADIRRHLASEPVLAGPPSAAYRLTKFARRNRGVLAAGAAVAVALVAGLVVSTYEFLAARRERDAAIAAGVRERAQRTNAERTSAFLTDMLTSVDPEVALGRVTAVRYILDEAVARLDGGALHDQARTEVDVRVAVGKTYSGIGMYAPGEAQLRRALEIAGALDGPESAGAARVMVPLSGLVTSGGKPGDGEAIARRAVTILEGAGPTASTDLAAALGELGAALRTQQRLDEAEPLYRRAVDLYGRSGGEDSPDTVRAVENLALLLYDAQRLGEAEPLMRDALARSERLLGGLSPTRIDCLNNLAIVLQDQGRYEDAERLLKESTALTRRVLGERHPETSHQIANLAALYRQTGRLPEAEATYREALGVARAALGDTHQSVAYDLGCLAGVLREMHRQPEAEPLIREALEIDTRVFGPDNPRVARDLSDLSTILSEQGKLPEAEASAERALEMYRALLGPDDIGVSAASNNLGMIRRRQGKHAEAEPMFRAAVDIVRKHDPVARPNLRGPLASTLQNLGMTLLDLGRAGEAEPLLRECVALRAQALPPGDWQTDDARSTLGGALTALKQFEEAEGLVVNAYAALTAPGSDAPAAVRVEAGQRAAGLYREWGKPEKAAPFEQTAQTATDAPK